MSWQTLTLRVTGELITASIWNADNYYNPEYVKAELDARIGCWVYKAANQTIGDSSATALTYTGEVKDTGGWHSTVSNTSRITVPADGYYLITSRVTWDSNATGTRTIDIKEDGSSVILNDKKYPVSASDDPVNFVSGVCYISASSYVETYVTQTSGGNLDVDGAVFYSSWMQAFRVG